MPRRGVPESGAGALHARAPQPGTKGLGTKVGTRRFDGSRSGASRGSRIGAEGGSRALGPNRQLADESGRRVISGAVSEARSTERSAHRSPWALGPRGGGRRAPGHSRDEGVALHRRRHVHHAPVQPERRGRARPDVQRDGPPGRGVHEPSLDARSRGASRARARCGRVRQGPRSRRDVLDARVDRSMGLGRGPPPAEGPAGAWAGAASATCFAAIPATAVHAVSGMGTALFTLLLIAMFACSAQVAAGGRRTRRLVALGAPHGTHATGREPGGPDRRRGDRRAISGRTPAGVRAGCSVSHGRCPSAPTRSAAKLLRPHVPVALLRKARRQHLARMARCARLAPRAPAALRALLLPALVRRPR